MPYLSPRLPSTEAALRDATSARPEAREAAGISLGFARESRAEEAARALTRLLDDPYGPVRLVAVESLARLALPDAAVAIEPLVSDPDRTVRQAALLALGELDQKSAIPRIETFIRDERPEMRLASLQALFRLDRDRCLSVSAELAADADLEVRAAAAECLGAMAVDAGTTELRQSAIQRLVPLLDDPDNELSWAAAVSIAHGISGSEQPAQPFGKGADIGADDGGAIRADTVVARVVALLVRGLSGDTRTQFESATALGLLASNEVLDAGSHPYQKAAHERLRTLAKRWAQDPIVLAAVGGALHRFGDPAGVVALRRTLRAFRLDGRGHAVELVRDLGIDELVVELVRIARRPRGVEREILRDALVQFAPSHPEAAMAAALLGDNAATEATLTRTAGARE